MTRANLTSSAWNYLTHQRICRRRKKDSGRKRFMKLRSKWLQPCSHLLKTSLNEVILQVISSCGAREKSSTASWSEIRASEIIWRVRQRSQAPPLAIWSLSLVHALTLACWVLCAQKVSLAQKTKVPNRICSIARPWINLSSRKRTNKMKTITCYRRISNRRLFMRIASLS